MNYLNPGTFSKHRHFSQDQISKTFCHGPNDFIDILNRTQFWVSFGVDQILLQTFWAGTNLKHLLEWTKLFCGDSGQDQLLKIFLSWTKCPTWMFGQDQMLSKGISEVNVCYTQKTKQSNILTQLLFPYMFNCF